MSETADTGSPTRPEAYSLEPNHPNPFNPRTTISYRLPKTAQVSLIIYNLLGQEVRLLVDTHQRVGFHQAVWDGRDRLGRTVASGVYLYRLRAGDYSETRKMILLK